MPTELASPTLKSARVQPCRLYDNPKDARQHLFLAAAALYLVSGDYNFRREADFFFDDSTSLFHTNWNNVSPLGVAILAGIDTPADVPEIHFSTADYQQLLRRSVQQWSDCSGKGSLGPLCRSAPVSPLELHGSPAIANRLR